jgi:hypothetical protein
MSDDNDDAVDGGSPSILPLSNNPDYADIVPIPQDDGPQPVVSIIYTDECTILTCITNLMYVCSQRGHGLL